jgi:hypothetical protein
MSSAQYRMLSPAGEERENGAADVTADGGALVLAPAAGAGGANAVLRVPFGQISSVTEPAPFLVRIGLADGSAIELSRLGVLRTQLLAELRDGRGDDAAAAAAAVGEAAVFAGRSGAGDQAEIRVYDDAVLIIGPAGSERISFSFVSAVQVRDYVVTIEVPGREPVMLSRLGRQTDELAAVLADRLRAARGRTAAFLGSLLPGLDPLALRDAAGLLRDGVAVPASTLDGIHPELARTLLQVTARPDRRDAAAELGRRTDLAIGFRQVASVRRAAVGVTPWQDHSATPHIGEHESPGGSFPPGPMGMMAAGLMSGGPFGFAGGSGAAGYGALGDYWAFRALGAGMSAGQPRPMAARPDVVRGGLTPATEDLAALTVTGEDPAVLAFVLGGCRGRVVYEVLNQPGTMTLVYRADGAAGLAAINRALDDAGFATAAGDGGGALGSPAPPAAGPPAGLRLLSAALAGQVPHDAQWPDRIAELLAE